MPVRRGCTIEWKIKPINSAIKKLFGRKTPVEVWLGISTDETQRMKRGVDDSLQYFHPLIERLHMSRAQCVLYLTRKGISAPPVGVHILPLPQRSRLAGIDRKRTRKGY